MMMQAMIFRLAFLFRFVIAASSISLILMTRRAYITAISLILLNTFTMGHLPHQYKGKKHTRMPQGIICIISIFANSIT